jgi:hypothetical protein
MLVADATDCDCLRRPGAQPIRDWMSSASIDRSPSIVSICSVIMVSPLPNPELPATTPTSRKREGRASAVSLRRKLSPTSRSTEWSLSMVSCCLVSTVSTGDPLPARDETPRDRYRELCAESSCTPRRATVSDLRACRKGVAERHRCRSSRWRRFGGSRVCSRRSKQAY